MSSIINTFIFLSYAALSSSGLILLKIAMTGKIISLRKIPDVLIDKTFISGFLLYVFGFIMWMIILSKFKLNIAFPIGMSLFFICSSLGSYFVLKEEFSTQAIIGIILCISGIIVISLK